MSKKSSRRQSRRRNHTYVLLGAGLILTLASVLAQPFSGADSWISDRLFTSEPPSPVIVIAGIDDETLQTFGKWSDWSRQLHAVAVQNLVDAGAQVVGFDVLFLDASPEDISFASSIAGAGNVVLPSYGNDITIGSPMRCGEQLVPVSPLLEAAAAGGHANIIPDQDGKVRRIPLVLRDDAGTDIPSFSLAMLLTLFHMTLPAGYSLEDGNLPLLGRDVPVDENGRLYIDYSAEFSERPYISYGDIIQGTFDPAAVKNKIVVIGMTATGDVDAWPVPTSSWKIPGVYIHAAVMDTILNERYLTDTGMIPTLLVMLALLAVLAVMLPRLRIGWGVALTAGLFIICLAGSFIAFDRGYIWHTLYPLVLLPLLLIVSIGVMIVTAQSDKRFITGLFGRYVSPQVADTILGLADTGTLNLGGERREVSVMFADIRQYTRLSENMTPEAIVTMLNTYLSVIIEHVLANGGMVNKFAGDNIMAVWNAPQQQADHARLAARAAWNAQQAIRELQEKDPSLPPVQFGIGINTGEALAGNIGSAGRSEYTVIGDAVNLASRICGATPGGDVWLGPDTYRHIASIVRAEPQPPQSFKGKSGPVTVYHLTGWNG